MTRFKLKSALALIRVLVIGLLAANLVILAGPLLATPVITATKSDALLIDVDNDNKADPGDTLAYTVVINNSGTTDAANVQYSDLLDANTTLTGTVQTTALALDDAYNVLGNVGISVPAGSGLLANDVDPDAVGPALTVVVSPTGTLQGGTVAVNADGAFIYDPPTGYEGADEFSYTMSDGEGNSDTATVSLSVNDRIWFINNDSAVTSSNKGTFSNPFTSVGSFSSSGLPATDEVIFVYRQGDGGVYSSGLSMQNGQVLLGQGIDLLTELGSQGITVPAHSLLSASPPVGTRPQLTAAAGNGITLAQNNTVRGIDVGNTPGGIGVVGSSVGQLTMNTMSITGSGAALSISSGTLNVSLAELSGSSATNRGLYLAGVNGSFAVSGGTLNMTGPTAVDITGAGSLSVNIALDSVSAAGGSSRGISLSTLSGTTTFSGVSISNSGASGLAASNAGTLSITGSGNSISTSGAAAVDISSTTIGSSGVTFQSITAGSGNSGIILNNTGSSGSFTITGSGNSGSGGTISNTIGDGISLTNVNGISLSSIQVINSGIHGIDGSGVTGFSLINSQISGAGNAANEDGLHFTQLLGTAVVSNSTISGSSDRNVHISNSSGTLASLTVSGSIFQNTAAGTGRDGFYLALPPGGSGTVTAFTVSDSVFQNNKTAGLRLNVEGSGTVSDFDLSSSTFAGNPVGLDLAANDTGDLIFDVHNNTSMAATATAINLANNGGSGSSMQGFIRNNSVNAANTGFGFGIWGGVDGDGTLIVDISNNTITDFGDSGIAVESRGGSGSVQATIANNSVTTSAALPLAGIFTRAGNGTSGETNTLCVNFSGNSAAGITNAVRDYYQDRFSSPATTFNIQGLSGTNPAAVNTHVIASDTGSPTSYTEAGVYGNATCTTPSLPALALRQSSESADANQRSAEAVADAQPSAARQPEPMARRTGMQAAAAPVSSPNFDRGISAISNGGVAVGPFILPAGRSITITYQAQILSSVPAGTAQICNQGTVTGSGFSDVLTDDPDTGAAGDATCTDLDAAPDLAVTKSVSDAVSGSNDSTAQAGESLTYQITISNSGNESAANILITDTVPANTTFDIGSAAVVTSSGATGISITNNANPLQVSIDGLSTGGSATISFTVTVADPLPVLLTSISNTAQAAADGIPQFNSSTATIPVEQPEVDIALSLDESIDPVRAGSGPGGLVYVITAENLGPDDATGVEIDVDAAFPSGVTVLFTPAAGTSYSGGLNGTWNVGSLPAGSSTTLTLTFTVADTAPLGKNLISGSAVLASVDENDTSSGNDTASERTSIVDAYRLFFPIMLNES